MFYPVALRILRKECTGAKKLAPDTFYYFVKGVRIGEDGRIYASPRIEDDIFNPIEEGIEGRVDLSFSAIVGANGSGKSTLVELLIRMCNNFGASVLGEYSQLQNRPHLHFIDGIYAELYYRLDNGYETEFYCLCIQGRNVAQDRYSLSGGRYIKDLSKDIADFGTDNAKQKNLDPTRVEARINIIDEPIMKRILREELNRRTGSEDARRRWIDEQIRDLELMRDYLDNKQR